MKAEWISLPDDSMETQAMNVPGGMLVRCLNTSIGFLPAPMSIGVTVSITFVPGAKVFLEGGCARVGRTVK